MTPKPPVFTLVMIVAFSVFGSDEPGSAPKMKFYSLSADGNKVYALNRGRAQRHADKCTKEVLP